MAINFQCLRQESDEQNPQIGGQESDDEQNPLVGMLDMAGGEASCQCYVLELSGSQRTRAVGCALQVTRCSITVVLN